MGVAVLESANELRRGRETLLFGDWMVRASVHVIAWDDGACWRVESSGFPMQCVCLVCDRTKLQQCNPHKNTTQ